MAIFGDVNSGYVLMAIWHPWLAVGGNCSPHARRRAPPPTAAAAEKVGATASAATAAATEVTFDT